MDLPFFLFVFFGNKKRDSRYDITEPRCAAASIPFCLPMGQCMTRIHTDLKTHVYKATVAVLSFTLLTAFMPHQRAGLSVELFVSNHRKCSIRICARAIHSNVCNSSFLQPYFFACVSCLNVCSCCGGSWCSFHVRHNLSRRKKAEDKQTNGKIYTDFC